VGSGRYGYSMDILYGYGYHMDMDTIWIWILYGYGYYMDMDTIWILMSTHPRKSSKLDLRR
jgi:hypothetical protein